MTNMKRATRRVTITTLVLFVVFVRTVLSDNLGRTREKNRSEEVNVGVVVDYARWVGKMGLRCIEMALSDFYASQGYYYSTRLVIHARDSKSDVIGAASAALDLIKNEEVQAIIGPVTSTQASFVVDLGEKAQVPIISYSATSSSLNIRSSYFFQATQHQTFEAKAISSIVNAFGWKQVVPIYIGNEYGEGLIHFLIDALQEAGARVSYRSVVSPSASDEQIAKELYKLMTMQTRVFVVHTDVSLGSRFFMTAKEIGMMEKGYVWIVTNLMTNYLGSLHTWVLESMQGVLGIKTYVPETKALKEFRARWKNKFQHKNSQVSDFQLNVYGLWAYDAATALAIAVEEVWTNNGNFSFKKINHVSGNYSTDLENFGVSRNGLSLRKTLSGVRFKGLAGNFSMAQGRLKSTTFEIINVCSKEERRIGFWTLQRRLVKSLMETNAGTSNSSKPNLEQIIWPGESISIPKGWEIPTNRKKLKIGVPKKEGFKEFVEVKHDLATDDMIVTGYCIDVFEAVMKALPYSVDYEFIPFTISDGQIGSNYDELVYQVFLGKFDAVVGDITIRANRSKFIDFTLPYTESGVSMIVPIRDKRNKNNAWAFLKPLTWDLWMTSACFFVFIGFVVWLLEHRINDDFRGPPSYQIGTSFWFSFSTMVFAHREKVVSNLARFVAIIWMFVVLILTQSYTASLTSLLTVQQLQPTVTDVRQLLMNQDNVGYIDGSFVHGILMDLGFKESQLKIYRSPEECDNLFSKKKSDGGIAAAFDEFPYMKFLLTKYCSKYTMVEPTFKTAGFGFVFPRGSPLVADVSRAILTVTEEKMMKNIENKWFGNHTNCPDPNTQVSSNSLGLESFWGLFLIVGIASFSSLIAYVAMFLYKQRHVLLSHDTDQVLPLWRRTCAVLRTFDHKDLTWHTFRKSFGDSRDHGRAIEIVNRDEHGDGVESLPNTNSHPSVSSYLNRTDDDHDDDDQLVFALSAEEREEICHAEYRSPGQATSAHVELANHERLNFTN